MRQNSSKECLHLFLIYFFLMLSLHLVRSDSTLTPIRTYSTLLTLSQPDTPGSIVAIDICNNATLDSSVSTLTNASCENIILSYTANSPFAPNRLFEWPIRWVLSASYYEFPEDPSQWVYQIDNSCIGNDATGKDITCHRNIFYSSNPAYSLVIQNINKPSVSSNVSLSITFTVIPSVNNPPCKQCNSTIINNTTFISYCNATNNSTSTQTIVSSLPTYGLIIIVILSIIIAICFIVSLILFVKLRKDRLIEGKEEKSQIINQNPARIGCSNSSSSGSTTSNIDSRVSSSGGSGSKKRKNVVSSKIKYPTVKYSADKNAQLIPLSDEDIESGITIKSNNNTTLMEE